MGSIICPIILLKRINLKEPLTFTCGLNYTRLPTSLAMGIHILPYYSYKKESFARALDNELTFTPLWVINHLISYIWSLFDHIFIYSMETLIKKSIGIYIQPYNTYEFGRALDIHLTFITPLFINHLIPFTWQSL